MKTLWKGGRSRQGFTIVELLLVIGVLLMLASLILPAVFAARSRSYQVLCLNNFRQLGTAVQAHLGDVGGFPRRWCGLVERPDGSKFDHSISGHAELLPYLGQDELANLIDWKDTTGDYYGYPAIIGENEKAFWRGVPTFRCPADGWANGNANSYRFNIGVLPLQHDSGGAVASYFRIKPADVTDGMSNTILMSERLIGRRGDREREAIMFAYEDDRTFETLWRNCIRNEGSIGVDPFLGTQWLRGAARHVAYNHFFPPNAKKQDCAGDPIGTGVVTARSRHPDGVNALYADGHATFIGNTIELKIWRALATRAAGDNTHTGAEH